jgi:hypothetical protein
VGGVSALRLPPKFPGFIGNLGPGVTCAHAPLQLPQVRHAAGQQDPGGRSDLPARRTEPQRRDQNRGRVAAADSAGGEFNGRGCLPFGRFPGFELEAPSRDRLPRHEAGFLRCEH